MPKAKVNSDGIDEIFQTLRRLGEDAEGIAKMGIYDGAGLIADAVRANIDGIRSDGKSDWETQRREMQKAGLKEGLTTSPIQPFKGGIYGGVVTPTEAGALAALYALFVEVVITRSINAQGLCEVLWSTVISTATSAVLRPRWRTRALA